MVEMPKNTPRAGEIRPAATGRLAVRAIRASHLRSFTWFNVLAPNVANAVPSKMFTRRTIEPKDTATPSARQNPNAATARTMANTRGLPSAK